VSNDELYEKLTEYYNSYCEPCRKVVIGNGRGPIDSRLSRLEWATYVVGGAVILSIVQQFFG
jgi:hypothetical protein